MKRIILTAAVIASAVACSKTEIVEMAPQTPISFGNTFVDNATRSIDNTLKTETLTEFQVYGSVTWTDQGANPAPPNTVNLYNDVKVKKYDTDPGDVVYSDGWGYSENHTQYWIEGNAYNFAAIVNGTAATFSKDANNADNMPLTISYNAAGQKDLLYAEHSVPSYVKATGSDVVKFTFNHLLSKVQFTFKNTMTSNTANNMYTYKVSDIKITNAYMDGTYTIGTTTWVADGTRSEVAFGNITHDADTDPTAIQVGAVGAEDSATSHYSMLLIPNTYSDLKITYTIETLLNNQVIDRDNLEANPTSITLEAGHAYNFVLSKGNPGDTIKFELLQVNAWDEDIDNDTDVDADDYIDLN